MAAGDEAEKPKYTPSPNAVDITPNKDGGVLKEIIKEGEGEGCPSMVCTATVHYHGTLTDGTIFDSTKETGKPFTFQLGESNVIKAWLIGIPTMKKGEVAIFTCAPEYAYGSASLPKIPANSTLIFEVTLIDWVGEDVSKASDGGILKTIIQSGEGYTTPNDGAFVEIHMIGKYDNKVFEERDVSFNLGEGSEFGVISGVETGLMSFKLHEKSSLEIKPKYAFDGEGHKEFGIPPNATVTYIVELKKLEVAQDTWNMNAEEKLSQAKILKEKATNYFKAGKYTLAEKLYENALNHVKKDVGFSNEENEERKAILLAVRLNLALTYLKLDKFLQAKKECDKALALDPKNVKGLFRRGQAYFNLMEPENAKKDFEAVVLLEPANKLAVNQLVACYNKIKEYKEKEKKIWANMFDKFAQKDKKEAHRFGWWDDEQKKPIIEATVQDNIEEKEDIKTKRKKQLEHLKKVAQSKRKEMEKLRKEEGEQVAHSGDSTTKAESSSEVNPDEFQAK